MTIYTFENNALRELPRTTFANEGILERQHLQAAIKQKVDIIASGCLVVAEEFSEWQDSQRRIDLLAIDKNANIVVIELKRTESGEQMELQAIRYAAMVSTLTFKRTVEIYQAFLNKNNILENAEEKILAHLEWDEPQEDEFALTTRIILASHDFSRELTTAVMWLNQMGLDITCLRMLPYKNDTQVLIDIQQIIPLPEAENYQVKIRQQTEERREARESSRDFTQYEFLGVKYNKRKLVLAVIKHWFLSKSNANIESLRESFPQDLNSGGLFCIENDAKEIHSKWNIPRHFLNEEEIFSFPDGSRYALSNQWGKGNLPRFIDVARNLGCEILEVI